MVRASDGWIFVMAQLPKFWDILVDRIGRPELAADYARSGLSVEAVRARLFDRLLAAHGAVIDNKEPPITPEAKAAPSPNTSAIYAARKKRPSRPAAVKTATPQAPIPQAPTP